MKRQCDRKKQNLFDPLMERHCFLKTNLFLTNLVIFLSCFDETFFMHQIVLSFFC